MPRSNLHLKASHEACSSATCEIKRELTLKDIGEYDGRLDLRYLQLKISYAGSLRKAAKRLAADAKPERPSLDAGKMLCDPALLQALVDAADTYLNAPAGLAVRMLHTEAAAHRRTARVALDDTGLFKNWLNGYHEGYANGLNRLLLEWPDIGIGGDQ